MICIHLTQDGVLHLHNRVGRMVGTIREEKIGSLSSWVWRTLEPYNEFSALIADSGSANDIGDALDLVLLNLYETTRPHSVAELSRLNKTRRRHSMRA